MKETAHEVAAQGDGDGVVVLGAGYGGLTAALRIARLLRKRRRRVTLVDRNPFHTLKTRLHEAAVRDVVVSIPIENIIKGRGIEFLQGEVRRIEPDRGVVDVSGREVPFGHLVIAIGSQANFHDIPGVGEHSIPLQTLEDASRIRERVDELLIEAGREADSIRRREMLRFVIAGGGLSGVELASELAERLTAHCREHGLDPQEAEIIVVEAAMRILWGEDRPFSEKVRIKLTDMGVKIITGVAVTAYNGEEIALSNDVTLRCRTLVWTGGIKASGLLGSSGLQTEAANRVVVDECLRAKGRPHIYAIGDDAMAVDPRSGWAVPAAAQFALQQGRLVAENIYADIAGRKCRPYRPRVMGEVVALGRHLAVGWLALPLGGKVSFMGFIGHLIKAAIQEKHVILLSKESRKWVRY